MFCRYYRDIVKFHSLGEIKKLAYLLQVKSFENIL